MIAMAELRTLAARLRLGQIRTVAQTGNLLFEAGETDTATLETRLEDVTRQRFDYEVPILVRTAAEWKKLVAANPFAREASDDPAHLLVFSLKKKPAAESLTGLRPSITGPEYFEARGRTLYVVYPRDIGHSKFTGALIERRLGVQGTGRNWNTVQKILAAL